MKKVAKIIAFPGNFVINNLPIWPPGCDVLRMKIKKPKKWFWHIEDWGRKNHWGFPATFFQLMPIFPGGGFLKKFKKTKTIFNLDIGGPLWAPKNFLIFQRQIGFSGLKNPKILVLNHRGFFFLARGFLTNENSKNTKKWFWPYWAKGAREKITWTRELFSNFNLFFPRCGFWPGKKNLKKQNPKTPLIFWKTNFFLNAFLGFPLFQGLLKKNSLIPVTFVN